MDNKMNQTEKIFNNPEEQSVTRRKAHKQKFGEEMSAPKDVNLDKERK